MSCENCEAGSWMGVTCVTCKEYFIVQRGQVIEHQTERAHSGRMRIVHVIAEEGRE